MTNNEFDASKTCLAVIDADADELMKSSSGGAFSVLARRTLDRSGIVYGHAFDERLHVGCVRVDSVEGLAALRGSKYVQSAMGDAMRNVKADLEAGHEVLFSGTPCQVDGLLAFLGGPQDSLLTVDVVCHGVPSQAFFQDCMSVEFNDSLVTLNFRDKREGWGCGGSGAVFRGGAERGVPFNPAISYYYTRFLEGDVYRESCYKCPYAGGRRPGDFTIGDFWGINVVEAGLDEKRGISVVITNTEKAVALIPYVESKTVWAERPLEEAVQGNSQLLHPTPRSESRDIILNRWLDGGIEALEGEFRHKIALSSKKWLAKRMIKKAFKGALGK